MSSNFQNGKPTIEPREKGAVIGQRVGFSETDLYKINKLYNCPQAGSLPEFRGVITLYAF